MKYLLILILFSSYVACSDSQTLIERGELTHGLYTNNSLGIMVNFDPSIYNVGTLDSNNRLVKYNSIGNATINLRNEKEVTLAIFINQKSGCEINISIINSDNLPTDDIKQYLYSKVNRNIEKLGYKLKMSTSEPTMINVNKIDYYQFSATYKVNERHYTEKWRYAFRDIDNLVLLISVINNSFNKDKTPDNEILMDFLALTKPL